ncbi:M20 aminoacylase family protein [Rhodovulum sp. DZ06]|uniref:M20 aminoacylase family protein n=1 Tax=Rhodovulum sp. DZ06 TaxID=3425126 RepID=UPI003D34E280
MTDMTLIDAIAARAGELTEWRRDFHAHPELGFEEHRTSGIVAGLLEGWGIETHRGIGGTGVVGVIEGRGPGRSVGLRADMDALPIEERTNKPWSSKTPGVMHACGHDGHTTMLLGAARWLAETRDFPGRVVVIFQPAEEGLGGARAMIADGLFERFPVDEIYGLHNSPYTDPGVVSVKPGVAMAGADFFDITLRGTGSHAASPQHAADPVVAMAQLVQALQTVMSRNAPPSEAAVLSVTKVRAGDAYNVIPGEAVISGTMRFFDDGWRDRMRARLETISKGVAAANDMEVEVVIKPVFTPLENDEALSLGFAELARGVVGDDLVRVTTDKVTGSEDFADMLRAVPGAYFTVGHKGDVPLHNPGFDLDDDMLPLGASLLAKVAVARLEG